MTALKKIAAIARGGSRGAASASLPAGAHHSTAAFDNARVVKLEGTITQFRWINPHASIKIDATSEGDDPDGVWTVEMTAPNVLINEGWTRTALQDRRQGHDVREPAAQQSRAQRRQHGRRCTSASSSRTARRSAEPTAKGAGSSR